MSDGEPTPGIFGGMGAYPGEGGTTILIRNHENRERPGEIKVVTGATEFDQMAFGGNTKLMVHDLTDDRHASVLHMLSDDAACFLPARPHPHHTARLRRWRSTRVV